MLPLRHLLCNALIESHYDYACPVCYLSLNKRLLKKIKTSQNKCIRYCLNLDYRAHVGIDEFIKINWLPTKERVAQCISVIIFKFFKKMPPQYMLEIFHPSHSRYNTRMATLELVNCKLQREWRCCGWLGLPREVNQPESPQCLLYLHARGKFPLTGDQILANDVMLCSVSISTLGTQVYADIRNGHFCEEY